MVFDTLITKDKQFIIITSSNLDAKIIKVKMLVMQIGNANNNVA